MSEWTKVKDGLPENMNQVVIITEDDDYKVDYFDPSDGWEKGFRVKAWISFKHYEEDDTKEL